MVRDFREYLPYKTGKIYKKSENQKQIEVLNLLI